MRFCFLANKLRIKLLFYVARPHFYMHPVCSRFNAVLCILQVYKSKVDKFMLKGLRVVSVVT